MGRHGVLDFEQEHSQPFEIDLTLSVDLMTASESDSLNDTVSYAEVVTLVKEVVESRNYKLLERLAGEIAQQVLTMDRVQEVDVTVRKPHAAVGAAIDYAAVSIHRP
jgi:dihydroneopterin aldolase